MFKLHRPWARQPPSSFGVSAAKKQELGITALWSGQVPSYIDVRKQFVTPPSTITSGAGMPGIAARFSDTFDEKIQIAADGAEVLGTTATTIAIWRRFHDTTARAAASFWFGSGSDRCYAAAPYSDGIIYWDFGDWAGSPGGRLTVSYTKDTAWETIVFVAGPNKGREIWRRGQRIAANSSLTAARSLGGNPLSMGGDTAASSSSDLVDVAQFIVSNKEWSDAQILDWCSNPNSVYGGARLATSTAAVQLLRPTSDISAGAWAPSSGSDLYAMLDEVAYDDADYIQTTSASTSEVKFGTGLDPNSSTGHTIRYRAKGTGTLTITLREGATLIATHTPTLTTSFQTFSFTLSGGEADLISNYADLRLRFVSS